MGIVTYVSGHQGLVGSALVRAIAHQHGDLLTVPRELLDLRDIVAVERWFGQHRPEQVIHAAGTVGGIHANRSRPVSFFYDNSLIHLSVLRAAHMFATRKLLYLGTSCAYPRECPQPIREEFLMSGLLEPTNEAYAMAKLSGLYACRAYRQQYGCNFIAAMPANLYGPNDQFDEKESHVIPALIRKFHKAKLAGDAKVQVWGTGRPRREFLHVDDLAAACWFLMDHYDSEEPINIGTGEDVTISELADIVRMVVYPEAKIVFDASMPDGTPRKLLDVGRIHSLGWKHAIELHQGIMKTYEWFCANADGLN